MSVLDLEKQVQSLPPDELTRFGRWFDDYRQRAANSPPAEQGQNLTPEQQAELRRRMTLARENPELLETWEGTIDGLRQELDAYRAQKAARRPA